LKERLSCHGPGIAGGQSETWTWKAVEACDKQWR